MTTHTVDITELAGLNCTDLTITSMSRAADTAELRFRSDLATETAPWAFGDRVIITADGGTAFAGYVTTDPEYETSATSKGYIIQLENIVGLLDATPYTGKQSFDGLVTNEVRLAKAADIIRKVISTGLVGPGGGAAAETFSLSVNSTIQCPIGSGSQSCWSLVNSCLHWLPNAVTWFNPDENRLSIRQASSDEVITVNLAERRVLLGDVELFSFAGYTSASFRARRDLQPPVVSLAWPTFNTTKVFPLGGNPNQPWAFRMEVPGWAGSNEGAPNVTQQRVLQKATAQKMVVRGHKVPTGWANTGNMKTESGKAEEHRKFWAHFPAMRALGKTNASCLGFGLAVFEAVPLDEAYPEDEEDAEDEDSPGRPENYKEFVASAVADTNIYAHYDGSFPASKESRDNVSGLKFCRGVLKQYVWLKTDYVGELSDEEKLAFFSGSATFSDESGKHKTRYALLTLECTFINRRRKVYKVGTNELFPSDPDYSEEEESETPTSGASDADYINAAQDYYNATRALFFDGSISLHGVRGYLPSKLDGRNLNIIGGRAEWENMSTPIVRAEWNPGRATLELSTGSPEILTIDERVQRMQLGRQSSNGSGTSFANPPSSFIPPDGEEPRAAFPMISPSVNASATVTKEGRPLNPFELYLDDGAWYLNEGTLVAPGGKIINFETTEVTELVAQYPNDKFTVRAERKTGTNVWEAVIRHYTPKSDS